MKIHECQQGSTEWMLKRAGVVTASEIDALVSPTFQVRTGKEPETYFYRKLAERIMGFTGETGSTFAMDQGNIIEKIAVPFWEAVNGPVTRVGFITTDDGKCGCSPDALVGDSEGLEVKAPQGPNHLKYLLGGVLPPSYAPQVQFSLWVTKRKAWNFMSFSVHLPPLIVRVEPDPKAFAAFDEATGDFLAELDKAEAKVRSLMQQPGRA